MPNVTLAPFAQSTGTLGSGEVDDSPVLVGGGSVSDGSDASYAQLGAYIDNVGDRHTESVAADFQYSGTVIALLLQVRVRNDADVLGSPVTPALNDCPAVLSAVGGSEIITMNLRWADIRSGTVSTATWYTWAFLGDSETTDPVDLDDPSDPGGWLPIEPGDDVATALAGDGLRFTFGAFWEGDDTNPDVRRAWIDLMEMRLIVATSGRPHVPPCHLYPRDDDQGVGTGAIWPPPSSGRPGSYY